MKRCRTCGETKPLDDFHRLRASPDGRHRRCRDCVAAYMREYHVRNAEKIRARVREWRVANPERRKELDRVADRRHKERQRAQRLAVKAALKRACPHCGGIVPPEKRVDAVFCSDKCNAAAHNATRKASRKVGAEQARISRAYIIARDGAQCHVCGKHCRSEEIQLDHLVPLACGGEHIPENLAVACARCNLSRQHRGHAQLILIG